MARLGCSPARVALGLGMAGGSAAGVAALSDSVAGLVSDQVRAQRMAALTATVCKTGGLAFGPLLAGILAQYGPAPRELSFLVHLALVAIAFVAALRVPGKAATTVGHWHPARGLAQRAHISANKPRAADLATTGRT
jgi:MFS family permease